MLFILVSSILLISTSALAQGFSADISYKERVRKNGLVNFIYQVISTLMILKTMAKICVL